MNKKQPKNLNEALLDTDIDHNKYKFDEDDTEKTHENATTISKNSEPAQQPTQYHETIQENVTLFSIAYEVLKDGLIGSATYFIMMGYIFFQGLYLGHTQKPVLYLASLSASNSYILAA